MHTPNPSANPKKKSLSIRLSESAVYLRTDGPSPRSRRDLDTSNSQLRGLLVLELSKPTKISSIEVELSATTFNAWPEGSGARRVEVSEEHRVFHASTVYFNAVSTARSTRRTASIGPGISLASYEYGQGWDIADDEDLDDNPNNGLGNDQGPSSHPSSSPSRTARPALMHRAATTGLPRTPMPGGLLRNRRGSVDSQHFQRNPVSHREEHNTIPIPPYSPVDPASPTIGVEAHSFALDSPTQLAPAYRADRYDQGSLGDSGEFLNASLNPTLMVPRSTHSAPSVGSNESNIQSLSRVPSANSEESPEVGPLVSSPRTPHEPLDPPQTSPSASSGSLSIGSGSRESLSRPSRPRDLLQTASPSSTRSGAASSTRSTNSGGRHSRFSLFSMAEVLKDVVHPTSSARRSSIDGGTLRRPRTRNESIDRSGNEASGSQALRGRTTDRRSQTGLSDAVPLHKAGSTSRPRSSTTPHNMSRSRTRPSVDISRIISHGLSELGIQEKPQKEAAGAGWKEFKKGTYTYPISFSIPSTAPPSLQTSYGSVIWRLNAHVHRPGTFRHKLVVSREVLVIACPTEEDTEDTENIIVERHWDHQLQYLISISGKTFYIGGTVPITFALLPLAKVKIYRLMVYIEERVDYYTHMHRVARTDPVSRIDLLSVKFDGGKNAHHILPLESNDPDALMHSPLFKLINPDEDLDEVASSLMGPGPWTFHHDLQLPKSCQSMHFTNKNRRANVVITHTMKVVIRVERGDDLYVDKTGKRKLFDIVMQTPIQILSCRCNPDRVSLPRYSESLHDSSPIIPSCPCQIRRMQEEGCNHGQHSTLGKRLHLSHVGTNGIGDTFQPDCTEHGATVVHSDPMHAVHHTGLQSLHHQQEGISTFQTSQQFERLVAGFETEFGEPPPAYTQSP